MRSPERGRARPSTTRSRRSRRAGCASIRSRRSSSTSPAPTPTTRLQAIERDIAPLLARHGNEIFLNEPLFRADRGALAAARPRSASTPSSCACSTATTPSSSAPARALDAAGKKRLAAINERLADARHAVQPERARRREGVHAGPRRRGRSRRPARVGAARRRREAAAERGLPGKHVITLSRSSIEPFLQFSTRRDLREKAFEAWIAARRERRRDRQPGDHRRDGRAPRRARAAPRLRELRRLPPRRHDGEDAGGGERAPRARVGSAAQGARAARGRRPAGADRRRRAATSALAAWDWRTTPRGCASAASISTRRS